MRSSRIVAMILLFLGLLVVTTAFGAEKPKASAKAKEHFAAGLAHVDDPAGPKYEEAYREFRAAYAEVPSYEIALNIGYCAFFLERDAEALEMYELFLSKATANDIAPKKRVQMERDIQSLRAGLVKVSLKVTPDKATLVDERFPSKGANIVNRYPIENGAAQLGIHPGSHRFTVTAEGYQPQSWEFEAQPASTHAHEFQLAATGGAKDAGNDAAGNATAPKAAGRPAAASGTSNDVAAPSQTNQKRTSPMVYVGAIATGVFAAGAVGMGLAANSKKSDFRAANDGTQYGKAEGLRSDAKTFALVSDICLGAAVVSAGVAAYYYFAGGSSASAADRRTTPGASRVSAGDLRASLPAPKATWKLSPAVGTKQAGLALLGTF